MSNNKAKSFVGDALPSSSGKTTRPISSQTGLVMLHCLLDPVKVKFDLNRLLVELRRRGFIIEHYISDQASTQTSTKNDKDIHSHLHRSTSFSEINSSPPKVVVPNTATAATSNAKESTPAVAKPVNYWILMTLSTKLSLKLAVAENLPIQPFHQYTAIQRVKLTQCAIDILMKNKTTWGIVDAWIAHDEVLYKQMMITSHADASSFFAFGSKKLAPTTASTASTATAAATPTSAEVEEELNINKTKNSTRNRDAENTVNLVYQYFGPQIAFYFGFLQHYTSSLLIPSIVGVVVYLHQWWYNMTDTSLLPYYVILLAIWTTWFLESWKRASALHSFQWGVLGMDDLEADIEIAKAAKKETPTKMLRLIFSALTTLVLIYFMLRMMLYYVHANIHAEEYYGKDSYWKYYPSVVYSLLPVVSPLVFEPIAQYLNDFEMHTTKRDAERFLIFKKFALQFVNKYSALFYVGMYLQDWAMLRSLLISLLTTGAIVGNVMELAVPYLTSLYATRNQKPSNTNTTENARSQKCASMLTNKQAEQMTNAERGYSSYQIQEDYLELVLQFGCVSMFAAVFPLTPFLAYCNNCFEYKVDLLKLGHCRRPPLCFSSSIGAWQYCLECISFIAVLSNSYFLIMMSSHLSVSQYLPPQYAAYFEGDHGKIILMLVLEHALLGFKVLLMNLMDDLPASVREEVARRNVEERERAQRHRLKRLTREGFTAKVDDNVRELLGITEHAKGSTLGGEASALADLGEIEGGKESEAAREEIVQMLSLHQHTVLQCYQQSSSPFLFGIGDPIPTTILFATPFLLHHILHWSPLFYLPITLAYFSYYHSEKERAERQLALNIVSSQWTLSHTLKKYMPGFLLDSDMQRVEWLNSVLQRIWSNFALALERMLMPTIQEVLKKHTPFFLTCLELKRCHMGTVAPRIQGIRVFQQQKTNATKGSNLCIDVELSWVGNVQISLKVGTTPMPTLVEVTELSLKATLRIEALDSISTLPLFKAVSVTCMQKPELDFSLKVANMVDLMNLSVAPSFSVTTLVQNIIHSSIQDTLLYPNKIIIPLGDDKNLDLEQYKQNRVLGILELVIEKAQDLKAVNFFGASDPYVEVKTSMEQKYKTKVKYNTCNPVWKEQVDFMVYDVNSQVIDFQLFDQNDVSQMNVSLGKCEIALSTIIPLVSTTDMGQVPQSVVNLQKTIPLLNMEKGALTVTISFHPVSEQSNANNGQGGSNENNVGQDGSRIHLDMSHVDQEVLYDLPVEKLQDNDAILMDHVSAYSINKTGKNKFKSIVKKARKSLKTGSSGKDGDSDNGDEHDHGGDTSGYSTMTGEESQGEGSDGEGHKHGKDKDKKKKKTESTLNGLIPTPISRVANAVVRPVMMSGRVISNMATGTSGKHGSDGNNELVNEGESGKKDSNVPPSLSKNPSLRLNVKIVNGVLAVSNIKCHNLNPSAGTMAGFIPGVGGSNVPSSPASTTSSATANHAQTSVWDFRPFVTFTIGNMTKETKYKKNDYNPEYPEAFNFFIKPDNNTSNNNIQVDDDNNNASNMLYMKVYDRYSKYSLSSFLNYSTPYKLVGYVSISIADMLYSIQRHTGDKSKGVELEFKLEGDCTNSTISARFTWMPSKQ